MKQLGLISEIKNIYIKSDKFTFYFACLILTQLIGFIPYPPSIALYGAFILFGFYMLSKGGKGLCTPILLFLAYIPIQLIVVNPDPLFKSWERYVLFAFLLMSVSPLSQGGNAARNRNTIFQVILITCLFVGVASFFCKFLGINYGTRPKWVIEEMAVLFGGITRHSMILGPTAGVGFIFCIWKAYITKSKIWWVLAILCIGSVMFSSSRSALMSALLGGAVLIYKLSHSTSSLFKIGIVVTLGVYLTIPLWGDFALEGINDKNEKATEGGGSVTSSRDALWNARLAEFESSPVWGVGFDAVDVEIAKRSGGFDDSSGAVESGTSWLIILSMTGLVGGIILFPFLISTYLGVFKAQSEWSHLILGVLTLFYIHMFAEGYIFYGGSILAFILWTTIGVAYDQKAKG